MSIKINFKNNISNNISSNLVLFADEKFNLSPLKKFISKTEFTYISDLLKINDLSKNLFVFELNSKRNIILVSIKKSFKSSDIENLGAEFYGRIDSKKNCEYLINIDSISYNHENFIGYFLHGLKLKSYEFNIYKSKKIKNLSL